MAIGRFGPEAQVEKRILRSSDPDANYELDFQCLSPTSNVQCQRPPVTFPLEDWLIHRDP